MAALAALTCQGRPSPDRELMFWRFLDTILLVGVHTSQVIALLTLALAIGAGWWSGLFAFAAIGGAVGVAFKRGPLYWATQLVEWLLIAAGVVVIGLLLH